MVAVDFTNRGESTASDRGHMLMTKGNIIANLSVHARIEPKGKVNRLLCECDPSAAEKHRRERNFKCMKLGKDYNPKLCGCKGRCYPAINPQSVSVREGLGGVMANEVESERDSGDEAGAR